jgi:hypothetical protein
MIVPSMSNDEIVKEILTDIAVVRRKLEYTAKDVRKQLLKTKKYPFIKCYDYISPTKNNWIYLLEFKSKSDIYMSFINYHYTSIGLRAGLVTSFDLKSWDEDFIFFTGHFFSRFVERENKVFVNPIDKIKLFFTLNADIMFAVKEEELEGGGREVIGTGNIGVVLGIKSSKGIFICNTYLSNEMLRKDQTLITSQLKEELDHYLRMEKEGKI